MRLKIKRMKKAMGQIYMILLYTEYFPYHLLFLHICLRQYHNEPFTLFALRDNVLGTDALRVGAIGYWSDIQQSSD